MEKVDRIKVDATIGTNIHIRGDDVVYNIEVIQWPTGGVQGFRLNILGHEGHSIDISNALWPYVRACIDTYLVPPKPALKADEG